MSRLFSLYSPSWLAVLLLLPLLGACAQFAPPSFEAKQAITLPQQAKQPSQLEYTVHIQHADTYSPYLLLQAHDVQERTNMRQQLRQNTTDTAKVEIYDGHSQQLLYASTHTPTLRFYDPVQHEIGLMLVPKYFALNPGSYTLKIELSGDYSTLPADVKPTISFTNLYKAQ
ncbi:hypothetical protein LVJ82_15525 [Vitreoscilla massiliensis]|uniref:DUF5625 domain-containing protein n=1 Tax=Vitreoscilla massiliensis TaxID=1689272 RepID=A0ABY4DZW9_9NEIS|nr:hypothetical protein [Vitreoscilla massiliensis]UOO88847.1 hypothetical protein LVJ82_15525 [Vitreoscilla massiliensis]